MKRLTREERRRIQRRAANIRFLAFVLILLALGVCIGYTAAHAQNACEPPKPQEVSQPSPVDDTPQEPAEQPAEDYGLPGAHHGRWGISGHGFWRKLFCRRLQRG